MTNLIKRLRVTGNGLSAEWLEYDVPEATNRTEELEAKLTECEARLSKAVESIKQSIKLWEKPDGGDRLSKLDNAYDGFELLCAALAELEK